MADDPPEVGRRGRVLWEGEPPVELEATHQRTGLRRRARVIDDGVDPRLQLSRDSAIILIGLILAILAAQTLLPAINGLPAGSASPFPSGVAIGSLAPPVSLAPGETFGPIIDPSLGIDATPTPIPVITPSRPPSPSPLPGPTARPTPTPTPTPRPTRSPKPTPSPTPKPTKTPGPTTGPTPSPTPVITPVPPDAHFTFDVNLFEVTFANTSSGDTSWEWDFGDGSTSPAKNPPPHTYASGTWTVRLTINDEPSLYYEHNVTVTGEPPG